jgi:hypothetical protein
MWKGVVFCFVALFLVAGCAEVPRPVTFNAPTQQHVQSASHWESLARTTVERLSRNPHLPGLLNSGIYVQANDKSLFDRAYRKYLITALNNAGYVVSESLDSPVGIYWDVQVVKRNKQRWLPRPGAPEFVAETVVWAFTGLRWNTTDFFDPQTEGILTTRFTTGGDKSQNIVAEGVYSDTFYINDADWVNYADAFQGYSPRSIAANDEAWKRKFSQEGLLSLPPLPPAKKVRE